MSEARSIFFARSREIRVMQRYMMARGAGDLNGSVDGLNRSDEIIAENCVKAAFIMMLYNLAEAVVVSTVHEIFQKVNEDALGYDRVAAEIRNFWLKQRAGRIKYGNVDTHFGLVKEVIDTALGKEGLHPFDREEVRKSYGGNVDGKVVKDIAAQFAVAFTPRQSSHGGVRLQRIKSTRNDLGHGIFSFSEVGATQSAGDLRETSIRVRRFLFDAVQAFDQYLGSRGYALNNG